MRKILTLATLFMCFASISYAQQDPMFTKYMFNTLVYNPAYAGSNEHMYLGLLHRTQWAEIDGAPHTQSLTAHTPLKNERVGVGLALLNDIIGPTITTSANLSYAYRIPIGGGKLAIGIQGGLINYRSKLSEVSVVDPNDESFRNDVNSFKPNFGAGIYYYSKYFYIGLSSPHLVEYDLREDVTTETWAKSYRHYFGAFGVAIPIDGDNIILKPSILVKNVGLLSQFRKDEQFTTIGGPTEFDLDVSVLFYEKFWVGASFRSAIQAFGSKKSSSFDSADVWVSYFMDNGLRVGMAYDYPLSDLASVTVGAFELMIGYEFYYKVKKTVTPRYF